MLSSDRSMLSIGTLRRHAKGVSAPVPPRRVPLFPLLTFLGYTQR